MRADVSAFARDAATIPDHIGTRLSHRVKPPARMRDRRAHSALA